MSRLITLCILLFCVISIRAQSDYNGKSTDDLFQLAREKAFNGEREEARTICRFILVKSPNNTEVKTLMARTYAWDSKRDSARLLLNEVTKSSPNNLDAYSALIDVELWDDKPEQAIKESDKILKVYPNNKEILLKKTKAQVALKKEEEAAHTLSQIESIDPGCSECKEIRETIAAKHFKHFITGNIAADFYNDVFDPMYYAYMQYGSITKYGTLIGRLNYSHRFDDNGIQPEVDFYPSLWKGAYAYLNYGFTISSLYPRHRVGIEIYQSLPKSLEVSYGFRYMYFDPYSDVLIYTGSLGWYISNYWLNLRIYLTPDKGTLSRSFNFTARKYLSDADSYIGIIMGAGFSPDLRHIQSNDGLSGGNNIYLLGSQNITLTYYQTIKTNLIWNLDINMGRQELEFSHGDFVRYLGFSTGVKKKF